MKTLNEVKAWMDSVGNGVMLVHYGQGMETQLLVAFDECCKEFPMVDSRFLDTQATQIDMTGMVTATTVPAIVWVINGKVNSAAVANSFSAKPWISSVFQMLDANCNDSLTSEDFVEKAVEKAATNMKGEIGGHAELQYLDICRKLLATKDVKDNRTSDSCFIIPPQTIQHDLAHGFPILTTKKMWMKQIMTELEFFIGGMTDKKWLMDRGCTIWDSWGNPVVLSGLDKATADDIGTVVATICNDLKLDLGKAMDAYVEACGGSPIMGEEYALTLARWKKVLQKMVMDLGPVYGYVWRRFGVDYTDGNVRSTPFEPAPEGEELKYGDQLAYIVRTLHENPNDRRQVCSAWNPLQQHQQALPPCHVLWNTIVIGDTLHLTWYQR